mgnify:CR=1 FL=1
MLGSYLAILANSFKPISKALCIQDFTILEVSYYLFIYLPSVLSVELLDDTRTYKPEYNIKGNDLRVCVSIIGFSAEELEEQCGGRFGDCLEIIDVPGNNLKFDVVNKTNITQKIQVTAFDPDYKINKVIDFPPHTTQLFQIPSDRALDVYA